jgi:tetratricopeptide (TPR) repeat protein
VYTSDGIKIDEVDANIWYKTGNTHYRCGRNNEAIECYDKAIEIDPNYTSAWNGKGLVLKRLKKYDEALKCYDKAIEINPNYAKAWIKKCNALCSLGKYEEAIKCCDKAIEINPNYAKVWIKKGLIQEWADGLKIIEEYPNHEKIGGFMQINPNYISRAYIKYYDKAIEINSNYENNAVDVWLELCHALTYRLEDTLLHGTDWEKERLEKALYCITKALECKSRYADNPSIWETKGHLLCSLERYEEAVKSYEKALEIEPDYYSAKIFRYGGALRKLGKDEDARKFFDHLQYLEEKYGTKIQFDGPEYW